MSALLPRGHVLRVVQRGEAMLLAVVGPGEDDATAELALRLHLDPVCLTSIALSLSARSWMRARTTTNPTTKEPTR